MGSKTASKSGKTAGKQNSGKASASKGQPQKGKRSQDQEMEHRADLSVLRQPINISVKKVADIVKMYQTCTSELRHLLDNELDIVYECKVCRNLFRSMANVISHKRVYCKQQYNDAKHNFNKRHSVEDYTVIIQPEAVTTVKSDNENWRTSDENPDNTGANTSVPSASEIKTNVPRIVSLSHPKKDLTQIIEELSDKRGLRTFKETVGHYSATNLYDDITRSIMSRAKERKEHTIHLEPTGSSAGVFQTRLQMTTSTTVQAENIDLMKAQVTELQHMVRETEAVLDEDGHIIQMKGSSNGPSISTSREVPAITVPSNSTSQDTKNNHVCLQCGSRFSTRKTLSHHMKSLHTAYRLCYPCPCCKNNFTNSWSVYRHLYKVHRKTTAQVRKLRPQIQNKAFKKELITDKSSSENLTSDKTLPSEEEAARNEQNRINQENKEWMDNFEDDQELQRCGGCGRRFERRAALTSHSQICQKRIAARKAKTPNSTQTTPEKLPIKIMDLESPKPVIPSKEAESRLESITASGLKARHKTNSTSWSDPPRKEVPGKRIEIQIRRDYCKFGTSAASSSHHLSSNFSRSVSPESITNISPVCRDETESLLSETENDFNSSKIKTRDNIADNEKEKTGQPAMHSTPSNLNNQIQDPKKVVSITRSAVRKRQASVDDDTTKNHFTTEFSKRRRATTDGVPNFDSSHNETKIISQSTSKKPLRGNYSSEELFSPVMESKMQALINLKRLQCLPCQKKFHKLTNLRRHVAVHIGWNRYCCTVCSYKCFAKYDCVHHICKVHGHDRTKAQEMVKLIECQGSDTGSADKTVEKKNTTQLHIKSEVSEKLSNGECGEQVSKDGKSSPTSEPKASFLPESPQNDKAEEENVELYILDSDAVNKDSDVSLELNCLEDPEFENEGVSFLVPDNEPIINSLGSNCNGTELHMVEANLHNDEVSVNEENENEACQESQVRSDDSRSDYENDSGTSDNEENPTSTDSKEKALRRMVMEVIFGSASTDNPEQSPIPNGVESGCSSPAEMSLSATEEGPGGESSVSSRSSSRAGPERRERPVRNRVCIRHEDFVYEARGSATAASSTAKKIGKLQGISVEDDASRRAPKIVLTKVVASSVPAKESIAASTDSTWFSSTVEDLITAPISSPEKKAGEVSEKSNGKV